MPNATLPYKLVLLQQIYEQGLTSLQTNIKGKKTNVKGVSKINKNKEISKKGLKENDEFHITIYIRIIHNIFNIKKSSVLPWNEYFDYNAIHSKCTSNIYTLQDRSDNG